jgi:hypothetical protein
MAWLRVASCKVICRGNGRRLGLRKLIYSLIWQSVMWRPGKLRFLIGVKNPLPIRPTATARKHSLGVTTAIMGNCGFGIVPAPPPLRDMIMRNLAVVEGMDLDALRTGINWKPNCGASFSRGRVFSGVLLILFPRWGGDRRRSRVTRGPASGPDGSNPPPSGTGIIFGHSSDRWPVNTTTRTRGGVDQ